MRNPIPPETARGCRKTRRLWSHRADAVTLEPAPGSVPIVKPGSLRAVVAPGPRFTLTYWESTVDATPERSSLACRLYGGADSVGDGDTVRFFSHTSSV